MAAIRLELFLYKGKGQEDRFQLPRIGPELQDVTRGSQEKTAFRCSHGEKDLDQIPEESGRFTLGAGRSVLGGGIVVHIKIGRLEPGGSGASL